VNQISLTAFKKMTSKQIVERMPFEVTADGDEICIVGEAPPTTAVNDDLYGKLPTKCPNCGMVYNVQKPDNKPGYFANSRLRPKNPDNRRLTDEERRAKGEVVIEG